MNFEKIALMKELNTYEYKTILLLLNNTYTLSMLAKMLGIKISNMDRHIKRLVELEIIEIDRKEGKNKFYRLRREDDINEKEK